MPDFSDRMALEFLSDAFVTTLLEAHLGLSTLFFIAYDPGDLDVQSVELAGLRGRQIGLPVFATARVNGIQERTLPTPERTHVTETRPRHGRPEWVDVRLDVLVAVQVDDRSAPIEEVRVVDLAGELAGVSSMEELRGVLEGHFPSGTIDAVLERLRVESVEDFSRSERMVVDFLFREPPPFDASAPESSRVFPLTVCVLFHSDLKVRDALRTAKLCREILEKEHDYPEAVGGATVHRPYAFVVLFPDSLVRNNAIQGLTAAQIRARVRELFAAEEMLAHFQVLV
jgi:hypothetical protein